MPARNYRKPRTVAQAFDEWMRQYKKDPAAFEHTIQSAKSHEVKVKGGRKYGRDCASFLLALMSRDA
jgi:hypothetical protein